VEFLGNGMTAVVQAIADIERLVGRPAVVVGGLAVLCRMSTQHRATTDLDIVDRLLGSRPHLELLREVSGAQSVQPAAVMLPTAFGVARVDVLEVNQVEIDQPSDDPGDRLFAAAHAWAYDTASPVDLRAEPLQGAAVQVRTMVAGPGPLIAMKLQAVMNRASSKQGTDLGDIVRLVLDPAARDRALQQIATCPDEMAGDIGLHANLWLVQRRLETLRSIEAAGGFDVEGDDIDLVAELLSEAARRA
jgi:hypothetical protein